MDFRTILAVKASSAYELLAHEPLGLVFFDDMEQNAHRRYGIDTQKGATVVVRPDGWVGTMTVLSGDAVLELEQYFTNIFQL